MWKEQKSFTRGVTDAQQHGMYLLITVLNSSCLFTRKINHNLLVAIILKVTKVASEKGTIKNQIGGCQMEETRYVMRLAE